MSGWTVTSGVDRTLTYQYGGESHEQSLSPGDEIQFTDPCHMMVFLRELRESAEQEGKITVEGVPNRDGYRVARRLCADARQGMLDDVEESVPEEPDPVEEPSSTGPDGKPEGGGGDGGNLNPPDGGDTQGGVRMEKREGEDDGRPLGQQRRDPEKPLSKHDVKRHIEDRNADQSVEDVEKNRAPPGEAHPDHGRDRRTDPVTTADPVDVFGGRYVRSETDVTIPSRGLDIDFTRTYRSGPDYFGPFGFNWDHSYNQYLRPLDGGGAAVWTGRLAEHVYTPTPDGSFDPPTGVTRRLEHEPATGAHDERYVLTDREGRTRVFARPDGWPHTDRLPLVRVKDDAGNAQELSYDGDGRLASVTDHAGRGLEFHYGDCGLLETVTDHTGRAWEYRHGADAEKLTAVRRPATDEHPDGPTVCYEYDDSQHPALRHNVARVVDENGETILENEYGTDPRSADFGRVVEQYFEGSRAEFGAERIQAVPETPDAVNVPAWRVRVIDPGVLTVYTFNYRGDLLDERLRLARDDSYRLVARTYRYDRRGNRIEEREPSGLGRRTVYDTDADDPRAWANPLRRVRLAPPASGARDREVFRATYEDRYQRPKTLTDEDGATTTFVYDYEVTTTDHGKLRRVEHPDATLPDGSTQTATETFEHDAHGRPVATETAAGHRHEFEYHASGPGEGLLSEVTRDVGGAAVEHSVEYDQWGNVVRTTDDSGEAIDRDYDALGRLLERAAPAVDGDRARVRYRHNPDDTVRRVERPRGEYDDGTVDDPYLADEFEYDTLGRRTGAVFGTNTANPRRYSYEYDGEGRLLRAEGPSGAVTTTRYDERGRPLAVTEAADSERPATTRFVYDRNGNRTAMVDPAGLRTDIEYDPFDRPDAVIRPGRSGERTTVGYQYSPNDRVAGVTVEGVPEPGAPRETLTAVSRRHDERGRPYERTAGGVTTTTWYDADGRIEKRVGPQGGETTFAHDGLDRVTERVDAAGNARRVAYAGVHGPETITDVDVAPDGSTETFEYETPRDARGRVDAVTDPLGNTRRVEYDARSLAVAAELPDGTRIETAYGLGGEAVERTLAADSPRAATHTWTRDGLGRVVEYVDPTGGTTEYGYGPHGALSRIEYDDGSEHRWEYRDGTVVDSETRPDGTTVDYGYDAAGRLENHSFTEGPSVASTPDVAVDFDGLGRAVELRQGSYTLERRYDERSRVVEETVDGDTVARDYDDRAGTMDLTYPDGRVDRYTSDVAGRLTAVTLRQSGAASLTGSLSAGDDIARYEYVGTGRLARRTLGNGAETTYDYDGGRRPTEIHHRDAAGDTIAALEYAYDAAGRRRVRHATPDPLTPALYDYDDLSRLAERATGVSAGPPPTVESQSDADRYIRGVTATSPRRRERFSVDPADDRLERSVDEPGGSHHEQYYHDSGHRIRSVTRTRNGTTTTTRFDYDGDGRRREDGRNEYVYDAMGRVVEVHDRSGGRRARLEYDPAGRVRERTVGGTTERLVALGAETIQVDDANGTPRRQRALGDAVGRPVAESDGTTTWAHHDPRGSLVAASDEQGVTSQRYDYGAFGVPTVYAPDGTTTQSASGAAMAPRFAGHDLLGDTGLYPTPRRLYDPATGRFTARDPNGHLDTASPYPYAANDPVNNVDPRGGSVTAVLGIIAVGAAIGATAEGVRQGIEMGMGRREQFDVGRLGTAGAVGGLLAPAFVVAPELAVPMGAYGVYQGGQEMAKGHYVTGAYDIGLSALPFATKGGRAATIGKGTLFGRARGMGPAESLSTRTTRLTGARSTSDRATHLTDADGRTGIADSGVVRQTEAPGGLKSLSEGWKSGAWVTPGRAKEMSAVQRLMTGRASYEYRFFAEFDVNPRAMEVPGGAKRVFGPVQRQIRGDVDLSGRNPTFGELPHGWDPTLLVPPGVGADELADDTGAAVDAGTDILSELSMDAASAATGPTGGAGVGGESDEGTSPWSGDQSGGNDKK
jgi:RHS repeat-associated protein